MFVDGAYLVYMHTHTRVGGGEGRGWDKTGWPVFSTKE